MIAFCFLNRLFGHTISFLVTSKRCSIYDVQLKHFKLDFTFFRYNDYLEIFDGSSNTAPFLTRWGGYGKTYYYFVPNNKILKCDGDEKCSFLHECVNDKNCGETIISIEDTTVELISGSSTLVTPKQ